MRSLLPAATSAQLSAHERFIVLLDEYPWSALCRIGMGYLILPLFSIVCGEDYPVWCVTAAFVGLLFSFKLVTTVLRKVLRFSSEVKAIWAKRRILAKRFDSYQWQKIFWLGVGMAVYAGVSERADSGVGVLVGVCLIGGGLGVFMWRRRATT